ncbi:ABC transporter permease [Candidatus Chloroploca sp. M-50]|uniref:ABC transporter permease n=1 Tax=Candidatus Chloroploca mongolica TaxID=2528176 RepID=A0ABS4DA48_9CHLR|nr:ABC transporter permease [Candidatus Chloroploca mongolica]MBP1466328.1 ABC transporter permease [Candidatus Chloroploca mongolica]
MTATTTVVPGDETSRAPSETQWQIVLRRFRKHKIAVVSLVLLVMLVIISALAPVIAPFPRDAPNLQTRFVPPFTVDSQGNFRLFGTDHLGRDFYTRLLYASRVSLGTAFFATLIASTIGILLGMIAGYFGGWVDIAISRTLEVVATFPTLLLLLIMSSILVQNINSIPIPDFFANFLAWIFAVSPREARIIFAVILVLSLFGWTGTARLMRGMVLSVRENVYIESSRALGASNVRILGRHVFPNALPPMIVDFTLGINATLVAESALSFLGFGIQDPTPTWGNMLSFAQSYMFQHPWMPLIPSLPILFCSIAINYIGDGLRDALDPRQRG